MDFAAASTGIAGPVSRRTALAGLLGLAGVAAVPAAWRGSTRAGAEEPDTYPAPGGLSLHLSTMTNLALDGQLVRLITDNYQHFSMRADLEFDASEPALDPEPYSYAQIVARIKARRPDFPVLMYTQGHVYTTDLRLPPEDRGLTEHNEQNILGGFDAHADWLVPGTANTSTTTRFWFDPGVQEFRDALISNIVRYADMFGVDGVFCDTAQLRGAAVLKALGDGTPEFARYQANVRSLFDDLRTALGGRTLVFNGLWSDEDGAFPGWFEAQQTMLPHADGATVELFGWDPSRNRRNDVTQYFSFPAAYPDKRLLLKGRSKPRDGAQDAYAYQSFAEDLLWQRYCYVAYLVCAGPNTFYQFGATFQEPNIKGRSGPDSLYLDWKHDLGAPLTPSYETDGTLYWRRFENAMVVLNPDLPAGTTAAASTFTFPDRSAFFWNPEGRAYRKSASLLPGQAQVLLRTKPRPYVAPLIRFDNDDCAGGDWFNAQRVGRRLQLTAIADPAFESEHDLMLDPVRSLQPCTSVVISYQTDDPDARFEVVVEVDDVLEQDLAATVSATAGAPVDTTRSPAKPFRTPANVVAASPDYFPDTYVIPASTSIVTGARRTLVIDVTTSLAAFPSEPGGAPRYTARHLAHMRIIGSVNLYSVALSRRRAPA